MFERKLVLCVFLCKIFGASGHCIDIHSQVVSQGLHYVPGPNTCTLCICDKGSPKWCKSVLCSPPQNCKSFQVGNSCCEFKCLDDILTANDGYKETYDFALRVIASAVTAILTLSVIFFVLHRFRRRKGRVHQNRQLNDDQRSLNSIGYITGNLGYIPANISYLGTGSNELEYHYEEASTHYSLWKPTGNYFPRGEAPPPYEEAVRSAQVESDVTNNQIRTVDNNTTNILAVRPTQSIQVNVSQPQIPIGTLQCHHGNLSTTNVEYANIPGPNITVHHASNANVKNNNVSGPTSSSLQNKNRKQTDKTKMSKSYDNILNNSLNDKTLLISADTKNCNTATSKDFGVVNVNKSYGKYENAKNYIFNQKRTDKNESSHNFISYSSGSDGYNENVRHRTIPNLSEYQNILSLSKIKKTGNGKDTDVNKRCDFDDKLIYGEQSESNTNNSMSFRERKDIATHRTLPKTLKELVKPVTDDIPNDSIESNDSTHHLFSRQYSFYGAIKSNGLLDKPKEITPPVLPVQLSIFEIKNQNQSGNKIEEEQSFISYQCLSSSQEEDDYRSECENCKSSAFTNGADGDESDVLNETMTLQRRPLEYQGEETYNMYRTSLTLPTHTRKSRIVTQNPGRESWFVTMQETSSSDESN